MALNSIQQTNQSKPTQNACGVAEIPHEDTACDKASQSCFETVSANPFLPSTGAKVVGGVLGAAALAGSLGFGFIELDQLEVIITDADSLAQRREYANAAFKYEYVVKSLTEGVDDVLPAVAGRAVQLIDKAISNRDEALMRFMSQSKGANYRKVLGFSVLIPGGVAQREATFLTFLESLAEDYRLKAALLAKLERHDEAADSARNAYRHYAGLIEGFEHMMVEHPTATFQSKRYYEDRASNSAAVLASYLTKIEKFEEALMAAEDAGALRGVFLEEGDFVEVRASSYYEQLKTLRILAELAGADSQYNLSADRMVLTRQAHLYDEMAQLYLTANSCEGVAWALKEEAQAIRRTSAGFRMELPMFRARLASATLSATSAEMYYAMVVQPDFQSSEASGQSLDTQALPVGEFGPNDAQARLLVDTVAKGNLDLADLSLVSEDRQRNLLQKAREELYLALDDIERISIEAIDAQLADAKAGILKKVAVAEEKLGDYEAAGLALSEMADILNDKVEREGSKDLILEAMKRAIDLFSSAIKEAGEKGEMRKVLRLTFEMERAISSCRADFAAKGEMLVEESLEMIEARKAAAVAIGASRYDGAPDLEKVARLRLIELAREVQAGRQTAFREFLETAARFYGKTVEGVGDSLRDGFDELSPQLASDLGGNNGLLIKAVREAAFRQSQGRAGETPGGRREDRDASRGRGR